VRPTAQILPAPLPRLLVAVRRRIRLQRALNGSALFAVAGLGLGALALGLGHAGWLEPTATWLYFLAATSLPLLGALVGACRRVPPLLAAQLLDRAHGLRSRVATALELAALPPEARAGFADAAIDDAAQRAPELSARRAMPLRAPEGLGSVAALAAGLALLTVMKPPPPPPAPSQPPGLAALLLHPDDLAAFETELDRALVDTAAGPEVREAVQRYNQLLEDLADRRLDRTEALRQIAALERRITEGRAADAAALEQAMRHMSEVLRRSEALRAASEALREADASRAEREMRAVAERLRSEKMSKRDVERLRQDLERVAQDRQRMEERRKEMQEQRDEMERLLQRQREERQKDDPEEERLLQKRQRELERLRREHQQMQEQQRQLERLQRELEQAMEDLNDGQQGEAADSLDDGAQDLNRMAREQLGEDQMRQLAEQLRQLREVLRRQRQEQGQPEQQQQAGGGSGQGRDRMERFVLRARGQGGDTMPLLMPGEQGEQGQQGGQGQGDGEGEGQGQGQKALMLGGQGDGQGQRALLEIPGLGQRGKGGSQGDAERGRGGGGPGTGSDHGQLGEGKDGRLDAQHDSTRVSGEHAGAGPTRSEVILGAADRGFSSRSYEKVYSDYRQHAEEVLEQDQVPPGYRFYVRRYFQLIRPREAPP
jgi:hypothetical protein